MSAVDSAPIAYNSSSHKLYFSLDSSDYSSYQLFFKTDTKIDSVSGNKLPEYLYSGTCSDGSCLPQNFKSAILKIKTDTNFYYYYFTLNNNQLKIVTEGISSQFDLTDEENNLLENGVVTQVSSSWTFEKVELNKEYVAPQNNGVKLTFTKLPSPSGNIKIEEITLTAEQIKQTGSLSDKAYDITSDMVDGTFAYNLSLPIPESSKGKSVDIKFAEEISQIESSQKVDNIITNTDTSVSVKNLDHFTIFVVSGLTASPLCTGASIATESGDTCYLTINEAVDAAVSGNTVKVSAGIYVIDSVINFDTPNVTLLGEGNPLIQVSGTGYRFIITASNIKIEGFNIEKTDKIGVQEIIWINSSNATIKNNKIWGKFTIGDDQVSRAMVISGGHSGLWIEGNEIYDLRQPAYISGITTGTISNNYVYRTKGWVLEQGNMTFTNNTWGTGPNANVYDIAIIPSVNSIYYPDIPKMSTENNNAFIEDQRTSPLTLSVVYVDGTVVVSGDGTARSPKKTIDEALQRVVVGGTINLLSNLTTSTIISIHKTLTLNGNNHIIYPQFAKTDNSNNSVISIYSPNVTIKNLKIDGVSGTNLHGLNLYKANNILLDSVSVINNDRSGITVNGSILTVNNLITSENGWGGVNIDQGSGVVTPARLTVNGISSHNELKALWMDDYTRIVSLVDTNHQYKYTDNGLERIYTLETTLPQINNLKYYKNANLVTTPFTTPIFIKSINDLTYSADYQDNSGLNRTAFVIWDANDNWDPVSNSHKCNWNGSPSTTILNSTTSQTLSGIPLKQCNPSYSWPSGKYIIAHIVYDNVGNSSYSTGGSQRFIIDNNAPTATINGVTPKSIYNGSTNINVHAIDANYLKTELYRNGETNPFKTYTDEWFGLSWLADGNYRMVVIDKANNSAEYTFTIDKIAPNTPVHVLPSNDAFINYSDFWFDWDDVGDAVSYEIQNSTNPSVDGNSSFTNIMWTGDYQKIQPTISTSRSVGANGTWYWQVRAIDAAGNKSSWTSPWKMTIDSQVPTLAISGPITGSILTDYTLNIEGSAVDPNFNYYYCYVTDAHGEVGIRNAQCQTAWSAGSPFHSAFAQTTTGTTNGNLGSVNLAGLVNGSYQVHLVAYDKAGNSTEATPVSFILSKTAPATPTSTPTPTITPTPTSTPVTIPTPTPTLISFNTTSLSGDIAGAVLGVAFAPVCNDQKPSSAPKLLSAIAGVNSVTLTWSLASDPTSYYLVTYGNQPGSQQYGNPNVGPAGTTSYTIRSLSGNTTYYFKVRAGNGCTPGDFSNELSATAQGQFIAAPAADFESEVLGVQITTPPTSLTPIPTPTLTPSVSNILGVSTENIMQWWWLWLLLLIPTYLIVRRLFKNNRKN